MKRLLALLLCLALVLGMSAMMAGCGGGSDTSESSSEPVTEETAETTDSTDAEDASFLYGSWFPEKVTVNDQEMDPDDFFNGHTFSWYFSDDGKATMWVDQNHALLDYELKDGHVTLSGDLSYEADLAEGSQTQMTWHYDVEGVQAEVLMEKYEE